MKKNKIRKHFKSIIKHPYFGFVLAALILMLVQPLRSVLGVLVVDAIGKTMIYFIAALGFTLLLGYAGLASLATASFLGLGSFVAVAILQSFGLPFFVAIIAGIAIAIAIGLLFGFVSLRIEGMYLAIVTLGISEIIVEMFKNFSRFTGGNSGINLLRFYLFGNEISTRTTFYILIVAMLIAMILTLNIIKSPTGRAMLAIKNSDSAAQAMGISILKYRLLAFVISAVYAVMAGLLYMIHIRFSIASNWGLGLSLNVLAAVIVGGSKSIWGIFLGTFMIFGLNLAVFSNIPFFRDSLLANVPHILSGVLIILVVMFYPGGLIRLLIDIRNKFKVVRQKLIKKWRDYRYGNHTL
ncbi:MAG: branched-chain amino acid ABC transporter permease [Acholeplasmataceae bacterium]|nr:branched-chain amino acid ABC transporter permease [Acholeplasmataceae bacterium]